MPTVNWNLNVNVSGTVVHRVEFVDAALESRVNQLESTVGQLAAKIAEVQAAADAEVTRITTFVDTTAAKIADLEAKIAAAGTPDPADLAALDALKATLDGVDPTKPVVIPEPTPTPTPEPTPAPPDVEPPAP